MLNFDIPTTNMLGSVRLSVKLEESFFISLYRPTTRTHDQNWNIAAPLKSCFRRQFFHFLF